MMLKKALQIAALPVALLMITATAEAATTNTAMTEQTNTSIAPEGNAWWVNYPNARGTLVGISPVAASVQLSNGTTQTFSMSNHEYHMLRGFVGTTIDFNVDHNVFHIVNA